MMTIIQVVSKSLGMLRFCFYCGITKTWLNQGHLGHLLGPTVCARHVVSFSADCDVRYRRAYLGVPSVDFLSKVAYSLFLHSYLFIIIDIFAGLSRTCLRCSHVTHISCWNSLDVPVSICPSGCGCFCTGSDGSFPPNDCIEHSRVEISRP
jgi:hypothetical protein